MKRKSTKSKMEKYNFFHSEIDEQLISQLENMNCNFLKYKHELRKYFSTCYKQDQEIQISNWTKRLPDDEINLMIKRLIPFVDGPDNMEAFHRLMIYVMRDYLGKKVKPFENEEEYYKTHRDISEEFGGIGEFDNFLELNSEICDFLTKKIYKKTLEILLLYDREKRMRHLKKKKKMKFFVDLMNREKLGKSKMTLAEQIKKAEMERIELIKLYRIIKYEEIKPLKDGLDMGIGTKRGKYKTNFARFLHMFKDRKDYVISLMEEYTISSLGSKILQEHKTYKLRALVNMMRTVPELLYSRDFSPGIRRYFTSFFIHGQKYVPPKNPKNTIQTSEEKPVNLISHNFLSSIIKKTQVLDYKEFASNQYFDNLSISRESLTTYYHSYSMDFPKIILILKNLEGRFIDEIDVFEDLIFENQFESRVSALKELITDFSQTVSEGFIKERDYQHQEINTRTSREHVFQIACMKYGTSPEDIYSLLSSIDSYFKRVYSVQNPYLIYVDYLMREELIQNGSLRFKLKDEKNPNKGLVGRMNNLDSDSTSGIKKIDYEADGIDRSILVRQKEVKELEDVQISQHIDNFLGTLKMDDIEVTQEKIETYLQFQMSRLKMDNSDRYFKSGIFLEKSYYKLIFLSSRNSLVKLVTYMNYFTSIQLRMNERLRAMKLAEENFEDLAYLRRTEEENENDNEGKGAGFRHHDDSFVKKKRVVTNESADNKIHSSLRRRKRSVDDSQRKEEPQRPEALKKIRDHDIDQEFVKAEDSIQESLKQFSELAYGLAGVGKSSFKRSIKKERSLTQKLDGVGASPDPHTQDQNTQRSKPESSGYTKSFLSLKETITSLNKQGKYFDWIKFEGMSARFLTTESQDNFIVKITDGKDKAVIYDKAIDDFNTICKTLKKTVSFFIENNLVDFCFDGVEIQDFAMEDDRGFEHRHMKMKVTDAPKSVNIEYLVYRVFKMEASFQAAKVKAIETLSSLLDDMGSPEAIVELIKAINSLIVRRPDIDFKQFEILNDSLNEICNNRISLTDINIKSIKKEIQNHLVTIFDSYATSIEYMKRYNKFLKKLMDEQQSISKHSDLLKEIQSIVELFQKKSQPYAKIHDNVDLLAKFDKLFEDGLEHFTTNLLDLSSIDKLCFTDEVIEENNKVFLKSMSVKIADRVAKVNTSILGKGIRSATLINFVRLYLRNMLGNHQNFIKANIRLLLLTELENTWQDIGEGFSQEVLMAESSMMASNTHFSRNQSLSTLLTQLNLIKGELKNEKREIILLHQDDQYEILRTKANYLKSELKERISILNSLHLINLFIKNQFKIRENLDSLKMDLKLYIAQKNQHLHHSKHLEFSSLQYNKMVRFIFDVKDKLTTKLSCLQRILKFDIMNCWDPEKVEKNLNYIADSKAFNDLISMVCLLFRNTLFSNNLTVKALFQETIDNISNLFSNHQIADKVISNLNITFKEEAASGTRKHELSSYIIYDDNPLYLTSRNKASGTEVVYSNKNESIVRRLMLELMFQKLKKIFEDPLELLSKAKRRAFALKGDESVNNKKSNYYFEHQPIKKRRYKKSKKQRSKKKEEKKVLKPCRFQPCQRMKELLVYIRRECLLLSNKIGILNSYNSLEQAMAEHSSWFKIFTKNVPSEFQLQNINKFFWQAVSHKEIEHDFLTEAEIQKSLMDSMNDKRTLKEAYSGIFMQTFPKFMKELKPEDDEGEEQSSSEQPEPQIQPFYKLYNIEELTNMFKNDQFRMMQKEINNHETSFITSTVVAQLDLPEGLFEEKTNNKDVKQTSLVGLLGKNKRTKKEIKQLAIQQKKFEAEKYERVSTYARNYYNNALDYILEMILMKSALFNKPKDSEAVHIKKALRFVSHLKFRTNMKGPIMEEDKRETAYVIPKSEKVLDYLKSMMSESEASLFNSYLYQVNILTLLYAFKQRLRAKPKASRPRWPTWVLKHIKSRELNLVYNDDELEEDAEKCRIFAIKDMSLKLIDIDSVNEINKEGDLYVTKAKLRLESNIISYMKARGLYSISYSRSFLKNPLRYTDLRLRVFYYEMQRFEKGSLKQYKGLRSYLLKYYESDVEDAYDVLKKKTSIIQAELLLSIFDLIFRMKWNYPKNTNRDKISMKSLKDLLELMRSGGNTLKKYESIKLYPHQKRVFIRNLDLSNYMKTRITDELDVLKYMNGGSYESKTAASAAKTFDFLLKNSAFYKLNEWAENNDLFTTALLFKKIESSHKNWQISEGREIRSIFQSARGSIASSMDTDALEAANNRLAMAESLNDLEKREMILNLLIKNCDLLEFLSENIGKQGLILNIRRQEVKKMVHRENISFNSRIEKIRSKQEISQEFLSHFFRNFMLDMVIQYSMVKNKNADVAEAISQYKKITRKQIKSSISVDSFDHYYHISMDYSNLDFDLDHDDSDFISRIRRRARGKDSELDRYIRKRIDCTFLVPETEQIVCNLGYILKACIKRVVQQKTELLGLRSIFFKRVNENVDAVFLKKKTSKRQFYGSVSQLVPYQRYNATIDSISLTRAIQRNEKGKYLPYMLSAYMALLTESSPIITKTNETLLLLPKDKFCHILGRLLKATSLHFQNLDCSLISAYGAIIDKTSSKLQIRKKEVEGMMKNFGFFVENFHKLVEGKLAENNFNTIYILDSFSKIIKYTHYDTSISFENVKEKIAQKYDDKLIKLLLVNKQLEDRLSGYKKGLCLDLKEFVSETHNENMINVRKLISEITKEKVIIYDKDANETVDDNQIRDILDDEKITKLKLLINKTKMRLNKILSNQIQENDKKYQILEEKKSIDENMLKKIRELRRREVLLRDETARARKEIKQLQYQNSVLERDIHSCNYERLALTKTIERQKKVRDDLYQSMKEESIKRSSLKKRRLRPLNSHVQSKVKQSLESSFAQRTEEEEIKRAEDPFLNPSDKQGKPGNEMKIRKRGFSLPGSRKKKRASTALAGKKNGSVMKKGRLETIGSKGGGSKKGSKFQFKNGKLERRFRINI